MSLNEYRKKITQLTSKIVICKIKKYSILKDTICRLNIEGLTIEILEEMIRSNNICYDLYNRRNDRDIIMVLLSNISQIIESIDRLNNRYLELTEQY
jgi:hypothetical protein